MLTNHEAHVVLPTCDNEGKGPEPIVFHTPAVYNKKVKLHDWQMQTLAEPRDNKDIFPPKGHLHISSYRRLGPDESCTGVSETQAMLSQVELKHLYEPVYPQRALLNMRSFALAGAEGEKQKSLSDMLFDSEQARCTDYRTTTEMDYRSPHPMKPRPSPPPPPPEPWLLNRRTIGYSLEELEKRDGMHTFLDDNMELHRRISDLKARRGKLDTLKFYDTSSSEQIDLSEIKECKIENSRS